MSARRHATVGFIFFTVLLDALGIGVIIPVGPRLIEQLLGHSEGAGLNVGILGATYAAMQLIFSPVLGSLSDHFGRRPVLLVALFGSGLDYFAMALSPTLWFLFFTRAINGLTGASITTANAYIADVTPPAKRAGAFGVLGAAFAIGFVFGPLLGGYLGKHDIRMPFYVAGGLSLLNWLYGCFVLPESLPPEHRRDFTWRRANPIGVFSHLRAYPMVLGLAAAMFLMSMAMFMLHATWVLYTKHRYNWDEFAVGLSMTVVGLGAGVVQGGLARKIIPRLGEPKSLLIGVAIGVLAYIGYGTAPEGWMIYVIIAVASLGGIAQPAAQSLITKSVPANAQGEVQGALTAMQSVATVLAFPLGGLIYDHFNAPSMPAYLEGASFYVSAGLCACGWFIAAVVLARHRDALHHPPLPPPTPADAADTPETAGANPVSPSAPE